MSKLLLSGDNPPADVSKPLFASPGKKRMRLSPVTIIQDHEKEIFRKFIYNFHKTEDSVITIKKLREKLNKDYGWNGGCTSLRSIVKELGFRWKKTPNNRKLLIERNDIRLLRINFLQKMKFYREQNRSIVYIDETYVHKGHTVSKSWSDNSANGFCSNISKGERLIIIHAGGEMGFLPNTLSIFKSGTKTGDYHDEMNSKNFGTWITTQLLDNLPSNSVVVIDNAPYHNIQEDRAPNSNSKKGEMVQWLSLKNIPFSTSMLKPQLYEIIKNNKKHHIKYKFDSMFTQCGHSVLRLPPYHPTLNPIELIWAQVKNNVARKNTTFKLEDVKKLLNEEFAAVTKEDWEKCCANARKYETEYWENETIVDVQTEELIINLQDSDSDSDNETFTDLESD